MNGYLILALTLAIGGTFLIEYIEHWRYQQVPDRGLIVGAQVAAAQELNVSLQHLEYESPSRIGDTDYYLARIYVMDREMPRAVREAIESAGDISPGLIGAMVNVMFFDARRQDVRRLLHTNGYIHSVDAPLVGRASRSVPDRYPPVIVYQIATRDTNGDGRINAEDAMAFYVSDLRGRDLRAVTPDTLALRRHWFSPDFSEIYFEEIIEDPTETVRGFDHRLRERRLYYYNLASGEFGRFDRLQELFDEIQAEYDAVNPL